MIISFFSVSKLITWDLVLELGLGHFSGFSLISNLELVSSSLFTLLDNLNLV